MPSTKKSANAKFSGLSMPSASNTLTAAIGLILVLLPFHAWLSTWVWSNFGHQDVWRAWKEIVIVACLPLAAYMIYKYRLLKSLASDWLVRLIGLYCVLTLVIGCWAYSAKHVSRQALEYGLVTNLRFFGFFIICLVAASTSTWLAKNWHKLLLIPGAVVVAFGLFLKFVLSPDFLRHFGYSSTTIAPYQTVDANSHYIRAQSTLRGANPLGAYLVLLVSGLLIFIKRRLGALLMAGAICLLFYSYSRSAWVGSVIAIMTFSWLYLGRKSQKWLLIVGSLLVVSVGSIYLLRNSQTVQDIFFHTNTSSISFKRGNTSNSVRDAALRNGVNDIEQNPLGSGPGTAGPASFRNVGHTARIAENYYLQIGQEVGVFGLLLFLAINILAAMKLWRTRDNDLAKVLLASLIGISFINLLSHAWMDDTLSLLWWGLAGIACADTIAVEHKRHGKKTKQRQ
jgi:O-antigen ligase